MDTTTTPPYPNNVEKVRRIKSIDGKPVAFTIIDEIIVPHGTKKLIYFQRLQHDPGKNIEYRLCYYMIGVKESRRGKWVFGQYALMIPGRELKKVLTEAKKRGWEGIA